MADDNPDNVLSTAFPAPPPFWKHFTPDNRARLKELQDAAKPGDNDTTASGSAPAIPAADLPPELRYLQPPAPPSTGKYRSFGDPYDINTPLTSLKDMGVEQLYPSPPHSPSSSTTASQWTLDRAQHIKRMTQSLLLNYLEMVGVLAVDPARWQDKYEHMQTLLFNAHHLINEYRPHQARASLIAMMEEQVRRRRDEVEGVRRMGERIEGVLAGLAREGVEVGEGGGMGEGKVGEEVDWEERRREEQRAVLQALDEELIED